MKFIQDHSLTCVTVTFPDLDYVTDQFVTKVNSVEEQRRELLHCCISINTVINEMSRHIVTVCSTPTHLADQLWLQPTANVRTVTIAIH